MPLETATYIHELNAAYPTSEDKRSRGDDHLRLIKNTIRNTFPNVKGAVTLSHENLNQAVYNSNTLTQRLGGKAVYSRRAGTGTEAADIQLAWNKTTGRLHPRVNEVDLAGMLMSDEFTGGKREMNAAKGFVHLGGGFVIQWTNGRYEHQQGSLKSTKILLPKAFTLKVGSWFEHVTTFPPDNVTVFMGTDASLDSVTIHSQGGSSSAVLYQAVRVYAIGWIDPTD